MLTIGHIQFGIDAQLVFTLFIEINDKTVGWTLFIHKLYDNILINTILKRISKMISLGN